MGLEGGVIGVAWIWRVVERVLKVVAKVWQNLSVAP